MKKQNYIWLILVFISMLFFHLTFNAGYDSIFDGICYAQEIDPAKEQIFKEAEEALQRAEAEDMTLLSPSNFTKANEFYHKALEDYEAEENQEKVRENLQRAIEYVDTAFGKAKLSKSVLESLIQTRKEAKALDIPKSAAYIFSKAESMFGEAAMKVEDGDLASARSIAKNTEKEYRVAVIEALRKLALADARNKLKNIEHTIPQESARKAKAELDKTESFILAKKATDFAIGKLIAEVHTRIQQALASMNAGPYDLMIEELVLDTEELHVGEDTVIRSSVRNVGNQPAEGITVLFLTKEEREIGRATIEHLDPAQAKEVNITATIPKLDEYLITVRVDPENLITESNEQNNEMQQFFAVESLGSSLWKYIVSCLASALFSGSGATFYIRKRRRKVPVGVPIKDEVFKVTGHIMKPDNTPISGAVVTVFDKNLRSEALLGKTTTNEEGNYEIEYSTEEFHKMKKNQPDLVVRASDQEDRDIASSKVIYNARQAEIVDLIQDGRDIEPASEYQKLMETLAPLLQDTVLAELTEEDITFLASKIGVFPQQITDLIHSAQLGEKAKCPMEVFYGLFRQNFPTSMSALLAQSPEAQRNTLETAISNNIVPATVRDFLDAVLERFQELVVENALEPLEPLPSGTTHLGDLLNTVQGVTAEQRREFLKLLVSHRAPYEGFWEELRENAEFREAVDDLQFTLQLGVLTQNHLPMVKKLKTLEWNGRIPSLQDLAMLDVDGWLKLINTPGSDDENNMLMFSIDQISELQDSLDNGNIPEELRQSFADNELPLSDEASISFEEAGNRWLIADNEWKYTVSREEDKLSIYSNIIGAPPNVPGENGVEKIKNYAKAMSVTLHAILTNKIGIDWLLRSRQ